MNCTIYGPVHRTAVAIVPAVVDLLLGTVGVGCNLLFTYCLLRTALVAV